MGSCDWIANKCLFVGSDGRMESHSDYSEDIRVVQLVVNQLSLVLCIAII